ncbi:hypothetical protein MN032_10370 [Agromyces atrinae]|uniref:Uncharacterized protein n=1 Tax=Agromyces atrinae TaxID=592376 RepID=A0A4Q2M573_9MICO|nr:hypothetical protein [Agromyces atrinae]MCI2958100.1 hypothetical protein [Agromyces atrinae]NYD66595.1 hypothetical protein [Agromyces atrinae]RXZ87264.1 hypothetical protein ESP50_04915 [Agromyces atrinae]
MTAWIVRHPLYAGWVWSALLAILLVIADGFDWPTLVWSGILILLIAPSLGATVLYLLAAPRRQFEGAESIFGHFFTRYIALIFAVVAWGLSVVLGAAISTSIQLVAEGKEDDVVGIGFELLMGAFPFVAGLLWLAFIWRCAWFLARVRGWKQMADHPVPGRLLPDRPNLRRVVIGLAHPALFFVTGMVSSLLLLAIGADATILLD